MEEKRMDICKMLFLLLIGRIRIKNIGSLCPLSSLPPPVLSKLKNKKIKRQYVKREQTQDGYPINEVTQK
jgi:hypothetical protein